MMNLIWKIMAAGLNPEDLSNIPCVGDGCSDVNFVASILGWAYLAVGVLAVGIIVFAGIQYVISEGEPEKTKRAQATITYTVIGLVVISAAAAIIGFVTGVFG